MEKKVGKVRRSREALANKMRKREADADSLRRQVRQQKKTIKVYETLLQASAVSQGAARANAAAAMAGAYARTANKHNYLILCLCLSCGELDGKRAESDTVMGGVMGERK